MTKYIYQIDDSVIMGIRSKVFSNAKKPQGVIGKMMAGGMNGGPHMRLAVWGMSHFDVKGDVLDAGCGGGGNVSRILAMDGVTSVKGLDCSEVSVEKSRKVNAKDIESGRCEIIQGNVRELPFTDGSFDTVTAFETVYFWPDIEESFKGIFRVLRSGGTFAVTNESTGTDEASVKYAKIIDGMNLYTPERLRELMSDAGFTDIETYTDSAKPWICVVGRKA